MKFRQIDLLAYGHFTNRSIQFPAEGPNFHFIFGSNEAGKSTSLRAITGLLYGIEVQTADGFLHGPPNLRIGARLQHSSGLERSFIRRKGRAGTTLLDGNGQLLEEAQLRSWLSVGDRKQFELMFGLSHEQLREAGQALADARNAAGEVLFGAALNGTNLQQTLLKLEEEARQLFIAGGSSAVVNKSVQAYREKSKLARAAALPAREWEVLASELAQAKQDQEEKARTIAQVQSIRAQLQRLQRVLPWLARCAELQRQRETLGDVRLLPPETTSTRRELQRELADAALGVKQLRERLFEIESERDAFVVGEALVDASLRIKQLTEELGKHKDELLALPTVTQEIVTYHNSQKELLRELGLAHLSLQDIESVRLDEAAEKRIRTLEKRGDKLSEQLRQRQEQVTRKRAAAKTSATRLAAITEPPDVRTLQATWQQVQPDRGLLTKLRAAETQVRARDEQVRAAHAAMDLWQGPPEAALTLVVPSAETVQRWVDQETEDAGDRKRLLKERTEVGARVHRLERELLELAAAGAVPSEDQLAAARERRDLGWKHVLGAWREQSALSTVVESYAAEQPLANAYASSVREADTLADQLRRDSDRVMKHAHAADALAEARRAQHALLIQEEELDARDVERIRSWKQLWAPVGLSPLSPREMLRWRTRFEGLQEALRTRTEAVQQCEQLKQTLTDHQQTLEAALALCGAPVPPGSPWTTVLSHAEQVLTKADQATTELNALRKELFTNQQELLALEEQQTADEQASLAWRAEWGAAVARLRLEPQALGEEASAVIDKLRALFVLEEKRQRQEKRRVSIEKQKAQFEAAVTELAARLAPDLVGTAAEIAEALIDRHGKGLAAAAQRKAMDDELTRGRRELAERMQRMERAEGHREELFQATGYATFEALEAGEQLSAQARALEDDLREANKMLFELGDGKSIADLETAAAGIDVDQLTRQLAELDQRLKALESEHQECLTRLGGLRERERTLTGSDSSARLTTEAQEHLATARTAAERYARVRLATTLLQRAIENYRQKNEGPILRRASELFHRLTNGRYEQLRVIFEDDKAKLRCVRAGKDVDVARALSDGTLDQLFLSLRLASIEQHLESQEPMPLVLDDIFIHFDDERTRSGLAVLAEVAKKAQVLLLTHHARNIDLARQVLEPSAWMEHRLSTLPEAALPATG